MQEGRRRKIPEGECIVVKRSPNPKGEEVNVAVEAEIYPTGTTVR